MSGDIFIFLAYLFDTFNINIGLQQLCEKIFYIIINYKKSVQTFLCKMLIRK